MPNTKNMRRNQKRLIPQPKSRGSLCKWPNKNNSQQELTRLCTHFGLAWKLNALPVSLESSWKVWICPNFHINWLEVQTFPSAWPLLSSTLTDSRSLSRVWILITSCLSFLFNTGYNSIVYNSCLTKATNSPSLCTTVILELGYKWRFWWIILEQSRWVS